TERHDDVDGTRGPLVGAGREGEGEDEQSRERGASGAGVQGEPLAMRETFDGSKARHLIDRMARTASAPVAAADSIRELQREIDRELVRCGRIAQAASGRKEQAGVLAEALDAAHVEASGPLAAHRGRGLVERLAADLQRRRDLVERRRTAEPGVAIARSRVDPVAPAAV